MTITIFGDTAQSYWQKVTLMTSLKGAGAFNPWDFEDMLEMYYMNNGLYDEVQTALYDNAIWTPGMKPLRNPAHRTVEFHASHLWPGQLTRALQIVTDNERIVDPIQKVWKWSNWGAKKQIAARWLGEFGSMLVKVPTKSDADGKILRVYLQLLKPQVVTEMITDERDFITYIRLDTFVQRAAGEDTQVVTRTEVWSKKEGTYRVYEHKKGRSADLSDVGPPVQENLLSDFGIDFIPIVHAKFQDIGEPRGLGAFTHALDKIDEANRQATRLHQILFRYNKPTKAISANGVDANGRPLPPPRLIDANGNMIDAGGTVETGDDDDIVSLPGMARMEMLIPNINFDAALKILQDQMSELEEDLPEMAYYRLKADANISGRALRMKISGAIDRCLDARGNAEAALARANQMALTIGKVRELEGFDVGDFEAGDFEHSFAERDVIPMDKQEQAEIFKLYRDANMPLASAAKNAGFTETEIEDMLKDEEAQREKEQGSLGQVLLEMERRRDQGR